MVMPMLGLKGSSDQRQIDDRLQYHPDVYEFYTSAADFTPEGYQQLDEAVQYVQAKGIQRIVIHHPMVALRGCCTRKKLSRALSFH